MKVYVVTDGFPRHYDGIMSFAHQAFSVGFMLFLLQIPFTPNEGSPSCASPRVPGLLVLCDTGIVDVNLGRRQSFLSQFQNPVSSNPMRVGFLPVSISPIEIYRN